MTQKKQTRQRKQSRFFNTKLGRFDEIPSTREFYDRVKELDSLKAQALVSLLYLSGARINEIVKRFRVNQIKEVTKGGHTFIHLVNMPTQKKRVPSEEVPRTIPIHKNFYHGYLMFIFGYIRENDLEDEDVLFDFSDRNARYLVDKNLGINNHRIRHVRATNLVREEGYTDSMLRRFFNWSKSTTAAQYTHHNTADLEKIFLQSLEGRKGFLDD